MKIRSVEAEFSHVDGRTDSQKLIVAFHNFAKAPKETKIHLMISVLICMDSAILCPAYPPFGASPARLFHLFQLCEFQYVSVGLIPFVANFPREFQAYYSYD